MFLCTRFVGRHTVLWIVLNRNARFSHSAYRATDSCKWNKNMIYWHFFFNLFLFISYHYVTYTLSNKCIFFCAWFFFTSCFLKHKLVNSLTTSGAVNLVSIGSEDMACCSTAPRHYLNRCQLNVNNILKSSLFNSIQINSVYWFELIWIEI